MKSEGGLGVTRGGRRDAEPWACEETSSKAHLPPLGQQAAEGFASRGDNGGQGYPQAITLSETEDIQDEAGCCDSDHGLVGSQQPFKGWGHPVTPRLAP